MNALLNRLGLTDVMLYAILCPLLGATAGLCLITIFEPLLSSNYSS